MMKGIYMTKRNTMLIVDDNYIGRVMLEQQFRDDYTIISAENGEEAVTLAMKCKDCLAAILLDLYMPVMDGFQVLARLKKFGISDVVPIFVVTIESAADKLKQAFDLGAVDVIEKPFCPSIARQRILNAIELFSHRNHHKMMFDAMNGNNNIYINKSIDIGISVNEMLCSVIEFRGNEDSGHIDRVKRITKLLTSRLSAKHEELKLDRRSVELIGEASVLHDIGKITIPDSILNKSGRLTTEEFEIVKSHSARGCELIDSAAELRNSEFYRYCYDICRYHHERVDGRGYPDRLTGDSIPIWSQIVSVVDVYDALVSKRCYKPAIQHRDALDMMMNGECGAFDTQIMVVFMEISDEIKMMYKNAV